ncbi:hypothetical protein L873DRAFT_1086297 [Choiromyces venosus 120613-1]|uniref:Uncharacterized protein n=1 Tax=Choiromyces venosus 120613-1 TaxID=1336337 RepID=A0A3N4JHJ9_9PEZI|nr:hypothetical protein L873DRAFT_1086297 [Choiromyces venosus 120613-1]
MEGSCGLDLDYRMALGRARVALRAKPDLPPCPVMVVFSGTEFLLPNRVVEEERSCHIQAPHGLHSIAISNGRGASKIPNNPSPHPLPWPKSIVQNLLPEHHPPYPNVMKQRGGNGENHKKHGTVHPTRKATTFTSCIIAAVRHHGYRWLSWFGWHYSIFCLNYLGWLHLSIHPIWNLCTTEH